MITDALTPQQHRQVVIAVQVLKWDTTITNAEVLIQEIIYTLLDPHGYVQANQHFAAKLKLIVQSIRDRTWKPSPRYQETITQLEHDLTIITSQLRYCHERIQYAITHPNVERAAIEKAKTALEAEHQALRQQLLTLNPLKQGDYHADIKPQT